MTHEPLYALLYISKPRIQEGDLTAILETAQRFNATHDITGALLHNDNLFMQCLEGPKQTVVTLYDAIKRDSRHKDVRTIWIDEIPQRRFGRWSMGAIPLSSLSVGLSDRYALNTYSHLAQLSAVDAQNLLDALVPFVQESFAV
ncbi:BLUF domain-containing protein [Magnetofaba australis]|uniref:BLUF domain-containing protein n=1 Tax=Magnetofaba australis IT-1 TaxID=1434232 RepID=A0A1Y2K7Q6_9PROT|nr:BLUF domain-containing protein [Magnetofaba australis]OSM06268.1 hypothetical protein MAIT1_05125 [Magnetofaba australis IT-1]